MISASVSPTLNSSLAFLSDECDWDPPPQLLAMVFTTTTEGELGQQEGCSEAAVGATCGEPHGGRRASEC